MKIRSEVIECLETTVGFFVFKMCYQMLRIAVECVVKIKNEQHEVLQKVEWKWNLTRQRQK